MGLDLVDSAYNLRVARRRIAEVSVRNSDYENLANTAYIGKTSKTFRGAKFMPVYKQVESTSASVYEQLTLEGW